MRGRGLTKCCIINCRENNNEDKSMEIHKTYAMKSTRSCVDEETDNLPQSLIFYPNIFETRRHKFMMYLKLWFI